MPRDEKMARLAKLLGTTPEFLRYGKRAGEATPGAMVISDDDERLLIEMYRTLPDWGKKSVRARVAELVENFTPKGPENPFSKAGKGTQ